jgi:hypothetical protein
VTFAATGSFLFSNDAALTMNNQGTGNLLLVEVNNYTNDTVYCSSLSGGGATWTLIAHVALTNTGAYHSMFAGKVTATGAGTTTPSWSGTAPGGYEINGHEFTSTVGNWALDVSGDVDDTSDTTNFASLTPGTNGELYFGAAGFGGAGAVAGSTSGYVYSVNANSDGTAYNVSCPSGTATFPVWSSDTPIGGLMVLMKEVSAAVAGTVQRRATVPVPRRHPARAYIQFTPVRTTNATGAAIPGTVQPRATIPIPRRRPVARALILFRPVTTINAPPFPPIPSGVVFGGQSAGGDRDPEIRMFRSVMPGEIPSSGSALPKLHGRGYAAPPPERAEDLEHLWEEPAPPAPEPGPGAAEIVSETVRRGGSALYDLGRILAPEPYVPPSRVKCGAIRKLGTETLRCQKRRGHPGLHSDRGVKWG